MEDFKEMYVTSFHANTRAFERLIDVVETLKVVIEELKTAQQKCEDVFIKYNEKKEIE